MFRHPVVIIEVNKESLMVELVQAQCQGVNIWRREAELDRLTGKYVAALGWYTSGQNRHNLVTNGMDVVRKETFRIHSPQSFVEFSNFVKGSEGYGNAEAAPGYHDDCVMASLIGWFCMRSMVLPAEKVDEEEKHVDWSKITEPVLSVAASNKQVAFPGKKKQTIPQSAWDDDSGEVEEYVE
jgi:hypothetical protein